jgi:hypothetical protein
MPKYWIARKIILECSWQYRRSGRITMLCSGWLFSHTRLCISGPDFINNNFKKISTTTLPLTVCKRGKKECFRAKGWLLQSLQAFGKILIFEMYQRKVSLRQNLTVVASYNTTRTDYQNPIENLKLFIFYYFTIINTCTDLWNFGSFKCLIMLRRIIRRFLNDELECRPEEAIL